MSTPPDRERFLLDASALLALLNREPGGDEVAMILPMAAMSTVNWSEVLQKARSHRVAVDGLLDDLHALGLELIDFGRQEAAAAAELWERASALALADRACLGTATLHSMTAITADRAWTGLDLPIEVRLIR